MMQADPLLGISMRMPPANTQAERALLGAIFSNSKALHAVVEFLLPDHFVDPVNGRIYREATRRILAGGVADPISLRTWFNGDPDAHAVGGVAYLGQLLTAMVGIINARDYGLAVLECWQRRQIIAVGEEMVNRGFAATEKDQPTALVSAAIDKLDAVVAGVGQDRKAVSFDEAMDSAINSMETALQGGGLAGISTGMASVDEALGGLEPMTMTVLAGRPAMGKSALGMQWAVSAAVEARDARAAGQPRGGVLVLSLEMGAAQLARGALAGLARVPLQAIKKGRMTQPEVDQVIWARKELAGLPLSIEDCPSLSVGMIRLKARVARRRHGLGLIVIDHLHIVRTEAADVRNGQTAAVGKVSNGLKQLAKEFECPVLVLAQLNRAVESREEKRPTLADLRQTGEIEQDADAVAFIYRADYYLPTGDIEHNPGETEARFRARVSQLEDDRRHAAGRAELIFAKIRDGSPQTISLLFDGPTTAFCEPP